MEPHESPAGHEPSPPSRVRPPSAQNTSAEPTASSASSEVDAGELDRPTRADRYRRRFADHPVGSILIMVVAMLGGLGAAVGGVQAMVGLFANEGSPRAQPSSSDAPSTVELGPADLKVATNWRYGFTINYPADWLRNDPVNQDGITADGPEVGMNVTAFGSLALDGSTISGLESEAEARANEPGTHVLEGPTSQNVTWHDVSGRNSELPGVRLVLDQLATEERPEVVTVILLTTARGRNVSAECQVPADMADRWRNACNEILSSLTVLGTWSE